MYWEKFTQVAINKHIKDALKENVDFKRSALLGIPGTFLDDKIFYDNAPFLEDAPFLQTLIANPNHIGCHTLSNNNSEPFFKGTQALEKQVISICAEQIFKAKANHYDGYVASGGTEANIQAMWIYRNYFMSEHCAKPTEIALLYSEDAHYSMTKGGNLLGIKSLVLPVSNETREIKLEALNKIVEKALSNGIKYFIVVQNMGTTMFGSIDNLNAMTDYLDGKALHYKLHIDAAFGGFIIPMSNQTPEYTFSNPNVSSFTLDGHKMLQTPYGTGIFLIRKKLMQHVETKEAKYVHGNDFTICGSRSGANAIAVWMTLRIHGSDGWKANIQNLLDRTTTVCNQLDRLGVKYYRDELVNIIAISANYISNNLSAKYHLIPDNTTEAPKWWKIVVMQHVKQGVLDAFLSDLKSELTSHEN